MAGTGDFNETTITATGASTAFTLNIGGIFVAAAASSSWNSGTVDLQVLLPDGSTWVNVGNNTDFAANGVASPIYLAPGQYRWNATTTTTAVVSIARIQTG